MPEILLLLSSPRGEMSSSSQIAKALVARLSLAPDTSVVVRDLDKDTIPHIDTAYVSGRMMASADRSPAQAEAAGRAEMLVAELLKADITVIAASMINFAPSSTLKAWIDHIVWPGRTMMPTPVGPKGMISGKKVYLVVASGGVYTSGPMVPADFLVPYLKLILGFVGITDIEVIRAEGQSAGQEAIERAVTGALQRVDLIEPSEWKLDKAS